MRHLSATVVYKCRNKVCSMNAVSALKAQCNLPIVPFVPCCADGACLHRLIGAGRAENRDFMGTMKQSVSTTNTFMILSALFLARYTHLLAYLRPTPILPQGNLPKNSGIERTSVSFWLNHLSLFCVSLLLGKKEKHLSWLIGVLNSTSENAKKNGNAATQRQKVRTHCSSFVWVLHLFCFCSSKPPLCRRCIPDYARMVTQGRSLVQRTYVLVSQFFFFSWANNTVPGGVCSEDDEERGEGGIATFPGSKLLLLFARCRCVYTFEYHTLLSGCVISAHTQAPAARVGFNCDTVSAPWLAARASHLRGLWVSIAVDSCWTACRMQKNK